MFLCEIGGDLDKRLVLHRTLSRQASIGSLSGELGKITMRTRQLIQQADDDDRETAIIKETIEVIHVHSG